MRYRFWDIYTSLMLRRLSATSAGAGTLTEDSEIERVQKVTLLKVNLFAHYPACTDEYFMSVRLCRGPGYP